MAQPFLPEALQSGVASDAIKRANQAALESAERRQVQRQARTGQDANVTDLINPQTRVVSTLVKQPKAQVIDAFLLQKGMSAQEMLSETPNDEEALFKSTIHARMLSIFISLTDPSFQTKGTAAEILCIRQGIQSLLLHSSKFE